MIKSYPTQEDLTELWPYLTPQEQDEMVMSLKAAQPPPTFEQFFRQTVAFEPHEWQTKHLCPILESLVKGKGKRFLVHGPPQYGKSILVSKRFPAWAFGVNPLIRIVLAGYNVTHAAGFGEVVRDIMHGDQYRETFPQVQIPKTCAAESFSTRPRAALHDGQDSFTAVGLLTGFTGKGLGDGDVLIIDDPYASPDDAKSEAINERVWRWWAELALNRITEHTNVLVMFHRYHEDDFAGRLLAEGGWEYKRFPALGDENEDGSDPTGRELGEPLSPLKSVFYLNSIKEKQPQVWLGQFQGRPRAAEGAFFHREWLQKLEGPIPRLGQWVRFWDLATKADQTGDYTAGALVGIDADHTVILRDAVRFRAEWPEACETISQITERDAEMFRAMGVNYAVGVEKVAWQRPMVQDLFTKGIFERVQLWPLPASGDKKERASGWAARAKYGFFRYAPNAQWNQDFLNEAVAFDGLGLTHDDQIDAVSGAYELLWALRGGIPDETPPPIPGTTEYFQALARANGFEDDSLDEDGS